MKKFIAYFCFFVLLAISLIMFIQDLINFWQLCTLWGITGFLFIILYDPTGIKKCILGKRGVLLEMHEIKKDIYAKKEEVEEIRDNIREIALSLADRIRFSTSRVGRLVDEFSHEDEVDFELQKLNELTANINKDKEKK